MTSRYHDEAAEEAEIEIGYYESIRPGLGESFSKSVIEGLDRILKRPRLYPRSIHGGLKREVRACSLRGFPFSVIYQILESEIVILAVAHHRHRPGYWRRRQS